MKTKFRGVIASLILGGILMSACAGTTDTESTVSPDEISKNISESETSTPKTDNETGNLFLGCTVFYGCGASISGDRFLNAMTDGDSSTAVTIKPALKDAKGNDKKLTFTDWYGTTHQETLDGSQVDFSVDLGFMSRIDTLKLKFDKYNGKPIRVFASTDGYNFSFFLGEFDTYDSATGEWTAELGGFNAKAILFVLPIEAKEEIKISSAAAYGNREHDRKLLSLGASYKWDGNENSIYTESGNKLTDGVIALPNESTAVVGKTSDELDPLTGKRGNIITLDLGSGKNVSEVAFGAYITSTGTGGAADRIDVRFSEDGENWDDFGQSYIRTASAARGTAKRYLVTRNHTVKARYIRIFTYTQYLFLCDEISVYGSDTPVAEPDYGYKYRPQYFASNTNVASYQSATLNGKDCPALTDNIHSVGTTLAEGENTVVITLKNPATIAGITLVANGEISGITAYGENNAEIAGTDFTMTAAGENVYSIVADSPVKSLQTVTIRFNAVKGAKLAEAEVYAAAPQLPYVRGGFFQLSTAGGDNESSRNSDYSWYLHLKGMRDMGMEYVVIQYSTHFNAKTTLINGKRITAAGYTYNQTYGTDDVCKAVLDAAEKLGMKVWLGTIHDSNFTDPANYTSQYEAIVTDSYNIIDDINEMYGSHPAFGGYYLSDETCDAWLNLTGGVDAARYVYKNQSDHIRKIAPDAKIMIAPAIWRSGDPEKGADNLYRMIMPETEGDRPVVDILAAQDCLGREQSLAVSDEAYKSYLTYVEQWAKAVRRAGAEFWHDAEVFEITSTQKRHEDLMKTLTLEAPLSGSIIVFDIPHYFSNFPMGSFNDERDYFKRLKMREYAEYYSTISSLVEKTFDAANEPVYDNDGKKVDTSGVKPVTPPVTDKTYNEGVISSDTLKTDFTSFASANGSGKKPEFALSYDSEAFYVLLKTNDASDDYGNGAWWEGKNDLVQLWITGDGSAAADVLSNSYGVRYYINRTGKSTFETGGEGDGKATFSGFTYEFKDGNFKIKLPWKSLGRTAPVKGDGTAIGILIQYIDGSDGTWAASTGNTGRSITSAERYSF